MKLAALFLLAALLSAQAPKGGSGTPGPAGPPGSGASTPATSAPICGNGAANGTQVCDGPTIANQIGATAVQKATAADTATNATGTGGVPFGGLATKTAPNTAVLGTDSSGIPIDVTGAVTLLNSKSALKYYINATDYGACLNSTTNYSTQLQSAVSALTFGGTVNLPAGSCKANITIGDGVTISGLGGTSFNNSHGPITTLVDSSGGTTPIITASGSGFLIQNLQLEGNGTGTTAAQRGIEITSGVAGTITNVSCFQLDQECILIDSGSLGNQISNVTGVRVLLNRTRSSHSGGVRIANGSTDNLLVNVYMNASVNSEGHSISANCYNDGIDIEGANNTLTNIHVETSELGLYIASTSSLNRVSNLISQFNYCSGAWVAGAAQFSNVTLQKNGQDGALAWDALEVTGNNSTFTGLTIDQSSGNSMTAGITDTITSDTLWNTYDSVRFGGTFTSYWACAGQHGCKINEEKPPVTIADATTSPDLSLNSLYSFAQSTALTINSFSGGYQGEKVYLVGNANVTLGTSGNILTISGSTELMQTSKVYCLVNVAGSWVEFCTPSGVLPQALGTTASPTFSGETLTTAASSTLLTVTNTNAAGFSGVALKNNSGTITEWFTGGSSTACPGCMQAQVGGATRGDINTSGKLEWSFPISAPVFNGSINAVASSATPAFNLSLGTYQTNTLTANVTSSTATGLAAGQQSYFKLTENSTGGFTYVWPTNIKGMGPINTAANAVNVVETSCFDTSNCYATGPVMDSSGNGYFAGAVNATAFSVTGGGTILANLSGTTGSIGGGALLAGACTSGTVAVTGSTTAMAVSASPVTYPGDGNYWLAYVSTAGTVTVKVCGAVAGTPTASTYNVRVSQ